MKIVFMGTPAFAAESLDRLIKEDMSVEAVFCQPDRPKGRGHKTVCCEVKNLALAAGIPVYQPESLRREEIWQLFRDMAPDLIVVVAYGRILPDEILSIPSLGCINVHGSLLPKFRGSAPIQRAVLAGEERTGVTTMYLAHEMDAGDIIYSSETEIGEEETSGELFERLAPLGAELLVKTIRDIETGTAPRTPQNDEEATYAPPLSKEEAPVDWHRPARVILKHIFGMQPWPCASARIGGTDFKLFRARETGHSADAVPGTVLRADKSGIEVACLGGSILITELQAPGGKRMDAGAYLRGHPLEAG